MSKGEKREKEKEREANQGKDSTIENKLMVTRGEMCVRGGRTGETGHGDQGLLL